MKKRKPKYLRIFLALILLGLLIYFFLRLPIFDIRTIEVTGVDNVSKEKIVEYSNKNIGDSLIKLNKKQIENSIKEIPQIEDVNIYRRPIGKLKIEVQERQPVAYIQDGKKYLIIDRNGILYEKNDKLYNNLCAISGIDNLNKLQIGDSIIDKAFEGADELLSEIFKNEDYLIFKMINLKDESCEIILKNDVQVKFGSYRDIEYKLAVINEINKKINEDSSDRKASMILLEEGNDPILVYE